ncbi:MAG TPA: ABC transporter permease [Solirubrobacteraceae bacterium]|nr:ABC transporter permease [Solirubrobacteraceae bacterium]
MPKSSAPSEVASALDGPQDDALGWARCAAPSARRRWAHALSPRRISILYFFALEFAVFALWVPGTFLTASTWRSLLDNQAITALVAVGFSIPLAAGAFDLAIGAEVGLGGILAAWLLVPRGMAIAPAIMVTLLAGAAVGAATGLLIVRARLDSFIATLGMSSILLALVSWISGGEQILNLPARFQNLATDGLLGIAYPVWALLIVAMVAWYVMERTPAGRRIYATGGNAEAARLAGVRTSAVTLLSLVACGAIAAAAGVLDSARLGVGDPTVGPDYLLPALAGVFLGSTQFRGGRVNVWGSVIAIYVLATGTTGLQLAGAPVWIPDLFNGLALLVAVGVARYQGAPARRLAVVQRALRLGRARAGARVSVE